MAEPDPRDRVTIINVDKRGELLVVEGVVEGKRVSVELGAHVQEGRSRQQMEALMRRSLYGTAQLEKERRPK